MRVDAVRCDSAEFRGSWPPPERLEQTARLFRALGDHARLRLLTRLIGGGRCVTELAKEEGESLPTISQRLRILRAEDLVLRTRSGKHIYYALADRHVATLIQNVLAHSKARSRIEPRAKSLNAIKNSRS